MPRRAPKVTPREANAHEAPHHRVVAALPYLPQAAALIWQAAPRLTLAWAALIAVQGMLPIAAVYLTRVLVDSLTGAIRGGTLATPIAYGVLAGALALLIESLRSVARWVWTALAEVLRDRVYTLVHAQALRLDLSFYETAEYYDRLHRVRTDATGRPLALLDNAGQVLQHTLTLTGMLGLLLAYAWWLPLVLLVATLPALVVTVRHSVRAHAWRQRSTPDERRAYYYDALLTWDFAAPELRLFDLGRHFVHAFRAVRRRLRTEYLALVRSQVRAELAARAVALLATAGTLLWAMWRTIRGAGTLGDLAALYQVFNQGEQLFRTLLGSAGDMYRNLLFLEDLFEFLALAPRVTDPPHPVPPPRSQSPEIRLQGVTFRYPGSEQPALDEFSLTIPAGAIVALVGENGAGKSTLVKLLCRFYDPNEGRITLDGIDLAALPLDAVWRHVTVLFQQPMRYHATASHNIAFGDWAATPDTAAVTAAAGAAGADAIVARLPDGYETLLGKWFGGSELSVGEWQRIALARAFVRRAGFVILDEPTSALDAWAEADLMRRFRALVEGRTALIITHRLTTAQQADVVHVMAAGRIVESGTPAELLARGSRYARAWAEQHDPRGR